MLDLFLQYARTVLGVVAALLGLAIVRRRDHNGP